METFQEAQQSSWTEVHGWASQADCIAWGLLNVFLYLIYSTKVVCEDRQEVLGKTSEDIVLQQN